MSEAVYLVGGAVRDELLGLAVRERDWVVTGTTPESLLRRGYRQVGAAFPVFLHPETSEEYALARTERKAGHGYHGFSVAFGEDVTIEQDLLRRDLTINAMARDTHGRLVDPYGGLADLEARVLRHVSPAFAEDPLRVLRVARFAARFRALGFSVHPDTCELMRELVASGELAHLTPERSWAELERALAGPAPRVFIETLRECNALAAVLPEVEALFGVPQTAAHHPEIDTGEHVLLSLELAARLCRENSGAAVVDTLTAVLLHDLGKALTPAAEWPAHHQHEQRGLERVAAVCERFRMPARTRRLALQVCEHHLRCHRLLEAQAETIMRLLEGLDALRDGDVGSFVLACEADWRGRTGLTERAYPAGALLLRARDAVVAIKARDLPPGAGSGPELGRSLRAARVRAIAALGREATG